uniref:Uncharacterized protein n=2 Tax=Arion vulgaris TaxID=1028688 RepID=A0A0B7AER8_9EUPU
MSRIHFWSYSTRYELMQTLCAVGKYLGNMSRKTAVCEAISANVAGGTLFTPKLMMWPASKTTPRLGARILRWDIVNDTDHTTLP